VGYVYTTGVKLSERLPWAPAKRRRALRRQAAAAKVVWLWEFEHLPAEAQEQIASLGASVPSSARMNVNTTPWLPVR
jgi:hypothetical protein